MEQQRLSELLFSEQNGEAPLFKSQIELSRVICQDSTKKYNSEASVKVYLNRVLKGAKSPSKNFQEALIRAVQLKAEKRNNQNLYISQIEEALKNINHSSQDYKKKLDLESEFDAGLLRECAIHASHHVIIRDDPAELNRTGVAVKFRKLMMRNLGVGEDANTTDLKHYEFYVGTRDVAIQFWKSIFGYLVHDLKYDSLTAREILKRLNHTSQADPIENKELPQKSLKVFTILPIIAASRLSLYDIENPNRRQAFVVNYDDKVSVSVVPKEKLSGIQRDVFNEIRNSDKADLYCIKAIPFQTIVDQQSDVDVLIANR